MRDTCLCGKKLDPLVRWDDDQATDIVFNLSWCPECGMIYKETPTDSAHPNMWIPPTLSHLDNGMEVVQWINDYAAGELNHAEKVKKRLCVVCHCPNCTVVYSLKEHGRNFNFRAITCEVCGEQFDGKSTQRLITQEEYDKLNW